MFPADVRDDCLCLIKLAVRHVCSGSLADIDRVAIDVRYSPESRHRAMKKV
jgi:hypothetical protein